MRYPVTVYQPLPNPIEEKMYELLHESLKEVSDKMQSISDRINHTLEVCDAYERISPASISDTIH